MGTAPLSPSPSRGGVAIAALLCLLQSTVSAGELAAGGSLSGVQLAWRDDPRIPADGPAGTAVPAARGATRRAQRRAAATRRRGAADTAEQVFGGPADDLFTRCHPEDTPEICPLPTRFLLPVEDGSGDAVPWSTVPSAWQAAAPAADPGDAGPFRWAGASATSAGGLVVSHRDEPYSPLDGPGRSAATARQRFDLHRPARAAAAGLPLVIWIPGESWRDAAPSDCPVVWLAEEGYAVASIGYRPIDAAAFPAQLDDCRAAIAAIVRHADAWGIDPGRVAVAGSGGGGHLAALVGLLDDAATAEQGWAGVSAVCAVAAPANLATLGPEHDRSGSAASRLVGGPLPEYREKARFASPITHVSPDDPPVLVVHGAADAVVRPRQAFDLDAALKAAGVDSALVILPGVGHRPAVGRGTPAGQSLLAFLERTIGPGLPTARGPDGTGSEP